MIYQQKPPRCVAHKIIGAASAAALIGPTLPIYEDGREITRAWDDADGWHVEIVGASGEHDTYRVEGAPGDYLQESDFFGRTELVVVSRDAFEAQWEAVLDPNLYSTAKLYGGVTGG